MGKKVQDVNALLQHENKETQGGGDIPPKDTNNSILLEDGDNGVKTIKDEPEFQKENPKKEIDEDMVIDSNKEKTNDNIVNDTPDSSADISKPFDDHMNAIHEDPESSNFMTYFFAMTLFTICAYLIFYNKKKLIALILEGRRGRSTGRRSRSGSRSGRNSSAQYRKLDNNLEEAMGPNSSSSYSQVIY